MASQASAPITGSTRLAAESIGRALPVVRINSHPSWTSFRGAGHYAPVAVVTFLLRAWLVYHTARRHASL